MFRSRKSARKRYEDRLDVIASALELVPVGSWTSHDDLADLVSGSPEEIAHLLADFFVENSYRVLSADGQVPTATHQHFRLSRSPSGPRCNGDMGESRSRRWADTWTSIGGSGCGQT